MNYTGYIVAWQDNEILYTTRRIHRGENLFTPSPIPVGEGEVLIPFDENSMSVIHHLLTGEHYKLPGTKVDAYVYNIKTDTIVLMTFTEVDGEISASQESCTYLRPGVKFSCGTYSYMSDTVATLMALGDDFKSIIKYLEVYCAVPKNSLKVTNTIKLKEQLEKIKNETTR